VLSRPLAIAITILVTIVWAANVVVGLIYPERGDATVSALFAIIVGAVFGLTPKAGITRRARAAIARRIAGDDPAAEEPEAEDTETPPRGDDQ